MRHCVHRAINPPKRNGPIPEKSYLTESKSVEEKVNTLRQGQTLDCRVNRLRPIKTPSVINLRVYANE